MVGHEALPARSLACLAAPSVGGPLVQAAGLQNATSSMCDNKKEHIICVCACVYRGVTRERNYFSGHDLLAISSPLAAVVSKHVNHKQAATSSSNQGKGSRVWRVYVRDPPLRSCRSPPLEAPRMLGTLGEAMLDDAVCM